MLTVADLTGAERRLVDAVLNGERLDFSSADEEINAKRMAGWGPERAIRCALIRQIMLDRFDWPDGAWPDPRGVWLRGARLVGELDLSEVESRLPLRLTDCHTTEVITLTGSQLSIVDLSGLVGVGVVALDATIKRSLLLPGARLSGKSPYGTVSVGGARIGAVFDAAGAHLTNTHPDGPVVHANNIHTGAGVFLNRGFQAVGGGSLGAIRFSGAVLGGQLNLTGASITNPHGPAVVADYLETRSNLMLNHDFHAEGRSDTGVIRLVGARVGGRLMCEGGQVRTSGPDDLALNLRQAHVGGDLLLPTSFAVGPMDLVGLTYDGRPRYATLTEWLDMLANRTVRYASQPYVQLADSHRAAGHERAMRRVHVARQRDLVRRGELDAAGRLWHRITGLTVGYGYRPALALWWLVGTVVLSVVLVMGVAGPAGLVSRVNDQGSPIGPCPMVDQAGLALGAAAPLVRSDNTLHCQIVATAPGQVIVGATWVLQVLAWAFVTLFVAGFTGLVRKSP